MSKPPRLVPHRAFPAYAYFGSPQPHPLHHPRGHSHGVEEVRPAPLVPERYEESEEYLFGLDLFNNGYYWEAHEAWEGLWNAAGRKGPVSEFLKGLIKMTAAGVKARGASAEGVRKHSKRAEEHFQATAAKIGEDRYAGFSLSELQQFAREVGEKAPDWPSPAGEEVTVVFDRFLIPGE